MSFPDRDPHERTDANDDLVCVQCERFPRQAHSDLCERCELFADYHRLHEPSTACVDTCDNPYVCADERNAAQATREVRAGR